MQRIGDIGMSDTSTSTSYTTKCSPSSPPSGGGGLLMAERKSKLGTKSRFLVLVRSLVLM